MKIEVTDPLIINGEAVIFVDWPDRMLRLAFPHADAATATIAASAVRSLASIIERAQGMWLPLPTLGAIPPGPRE